MEKFVKEFNKLLGPLALNLIIIINASIDLYRHYYIIKFNKIWLVWIVVIISIIIIALNICIRTWNIYLKYIINKKIKFEKVKISTRSSLNNIFKENKNFIGRRKKKYYGLLSSSTSSTITPTNELFRINKKDINRKKIMFFLFTFLTILKWLLLIFSIFECIFNITT